MPSRRSRKRPDPAAPAEAHSSSFTRDYRFAAQPSELRHARRHADCAAASFGLDSRDRFDFVFAANEAVTNAIRHGTPDAEGQIHVRIAADAETLTLAVSDCGPFVTPGSRDAAGEHGRGFEYMERMVDEVELSVGDGTTLRLSKHRAPRAGSAAPP